MTTRGEDIFGYVVAVVRTSTDGQARLGTILAQKAELPKTASRMGFDIKEWIEDDGASGRRIDGRNLKTLLGRIEAGGTRVTAILAVDLDRLMRPDPALLESMRDWAYLSWVLDTRDVRVIDAQGNVVRVGSVEERFRINSQFFEKLLIPNSNIMRVYLAPDSHSGY